MNGNGKSWTQSLWYWRLAIFECLTDAFIAGSMVWISSVQDTEWEKLSLTARHTIVVCIIVAMLKVVKSFLSTTISVLQDAMPLPAGVTAHQETKEVTKTVIDTPPPPAVSSMEAVNNPKP